MRSVARTLADITTSCERLQSVMESQSGLGVSTGTMLCFVTGDALRRLILTASGVADSSGSTLVIVAQRVGEVGE